jgi:hypothetical protein
MHTSRRGSMTEDKIDSLVGLWWLPETPDDCVAGTLSIDGKGNPTLKTVVSLEDPPAEMVHPLCPSEPHDWQYVCGRVPGNICVLEGLRPARSTNYSNPKSREVTYAVHVAYLGLNDPITPPAFLDLAVEIDTLGPWMGFAPIEMLESKDGADRDSGFRYKEPPDIDLGSIGRFTARLRRGCNSHYSRRSASLDVRAMFVLEAQEPFTLNDCWDTLNAVCSFLSLITSYPAAVNMLSGRPFVAASTPPQNMLQPRIVVSGLGDQPTWDDLIPWQMPIVMDDLPLEAVRSCLQAWFAASGTLKPVYDLVQDFTSDLDSYSRGRFLTAVQALEVLDRKTRQATYMPADTFERWVDCAKQSAPEPAIGWFAKTLDHANEPSLYQRLLFLAEQCTAVLGISDSALEWQKHLARQAADTRNYFTHYSRDPRPTSAVQDTQLAVLTIWIENIVRMTLFRQLGVPDDDQRRLSWAATRSWWFRARQLFLPPASS